MPKAIKVEWYKDDKDLNEIYQRTQIQFAFMTAPKNGNKQCHPFVLCRDFLHDAVKCSWLKTGCVIYGFSFDFDKNPPIDLKQMRMLVTKKTIEDSEETDFHDKMKISLSLLNHYENMAGWTKSKLYRIKDDNVKAWLFIGSNMWLKSPFLVSMYSFLIRLGDKYNVIKGFKDNKDLNERLKKISELKNEGGDNDIHYIKTSWNKLDKVIQHRNKLFFEKEKPDPVFKTSSINRFHDKAGILSLCRYETPDPILNTKARKLLGGDK